MIYSLFQILEDSGFPTAYGLHHIPRRNVVHAGYADSLDFRSHNHSPPAENAGGRGGAQPWPRGADEQDRNPTMGGVIIILSILVPCILLGNLSNIYMILMLVATVWMGSIGFLDDYRKIKYHNKDGLKGKYKVTGQVGLGLIVGVTMWLSPQIVMSENMEVMNQSSHTTEIIHSMNYVKSPQTTIPFVKNNNFNYEWLTDWIGNANTAETLGWLVFVFVVIIVVTAVSNGANLTDGLGGTLRRHIGNHRGGLAIMAYLGGNIIYSGYLNIMYIRAARSLWYMPQGIHRGLW